jgi:alpha-tubulin suppressor-like RCC1 family protein
MIPGGRVAIFGWGSSGGGGGAYGLWAWGINTAGVGNLGFGISTFVKYSSPKQVGGNDTWTFVSGSIPKTVHAIKSSGTLWAWGRNSNGELGLGNTTYYSSPKQVGALTTWSKISDCAYGSAAGIKTDGTLWTWGYNNSGQLGLGNLTSYSSPKQVGALTNWSNIVGINKGFLALKTDGTLWSWGQNSNGVLGQGNTVAYSSPKQIGALTTWAFLPLNDSGAVNAGAIKTDGTLWVWGFNNNGQLGLGNITQYSSPKQVGALTTWAKCSFGDYQNSFGITTGNALWAWGRNNNGELGLGNTTNYSSPKQVGALTDWSTIKASSQNPVAMKTGGTIWSWGRNNNGTIGIGNTTYYSSPKQIGALTTWFFATGAGQTGSQFAFGLRT